MEINNNNKEIAITLAKRLLVKNVKFEEKCKFPNYSFEAGGLCKNGGYTRFINSCSGVEFICRNNNINNVSVYHFAPEMRGPLLNDKFTKLCERLKNTNEDVSALLVGGLGLSKANSKEITQSFDLLATLGGIIDNKGIKLSMIGGKKVEKLRESVAAFDNKFRIELMDSPEVTKELESLGKNPSPKQIQALFEKTHEIGEINDNHILNFEV